MHTSDHAYSTCSSFHDLPEFDLPHVDWRLLVDEMNVSFGIFRYVWATDGPDGHPSDIVLLYANDHYASYLGRLGFGADILDGRGYVESGQVLDAQMDADIRHVLEERRQANGTLYVTSMGCWIAYYLFPIGFKDCYGVMLLDITQAHERIERAEHLGRTDVLTEVANRNALEHALDALRDEDVELGALLCDLNGLKELNDREGHVAGDAAIVAAARLLTARFPAWDVYRYGGDEFVVLALGVEKAVFDKEAARFVCECEEMEGQEPGVMDAAEPGSAGVARDGSAGGSSGVARDGGDGGSAGDADEHSVSLSAGAAWGPSSRSIDGIIQTADREMYARKRAYYQTHDRRHH